MLGEGSRGATLEMTLAKILYASSKSWLQLMLLKYCSDGIPREKAHFGCLCLCPLLKKRAVTVFTHLSVKLVDPVMKGWMFLKLFWYFSEKS